MYSASLTLKWWHQDLRNLLLYGNRVSEKMPIKIWFKCHVETHTTLSPFWPNTLLAFLTRKWGWRREVTCWPIPTRRISNFLHRKPNCLTFDPLGIPLVCQLPQISRRHLTTLIHRCALRLLCSQKTSSSSSSSPSPQFLPLRRLVYSV